MRQVNLALDAIFRPGWKRHELKERGEAERWIVSKGTRRSYGGHCCRFVLWCRERYRIRFLRELRPEMGAEYLAELEASGRSPWTLPAVRAALRKLRWGILEAFKVWVETVPPNLKLPTRSYHVRKQAGAYTEAEARAILGRVQGVVGDLLRAQYYMGLRVREAARLRREDVDLELDLVRVKGKGGRRRAVPIPPEASEWIRGLVAATAPGQRLFPVAVRRVQAATRKACQQEGISPHGTHGFRHSYAMRVYQGLREQGLSDATARAVVTVRLGHNRPQVTVAYVPRPPRR